MRIFNRQVSAKGMTMFGIDAILIPSAIVAVAGVSTGPMKGPGNLWAVVLMASLCELCFYYNDLYDFTIVHSTRELVIRVLQATGAAAIVLGAAHATAPSLSLGTPTVITALTLIVATVLLWRVAFATFAQDARFAERLLILGTGSTAQLVAGRIASQMDFAYRLVGFVDDGSGAHCVRAQNILGSIDDIERLIDTWHVDRIVVGLSDRRGRLPIAALLRAKLAGVRVEDATTTYERLTGKILLDDLKPSWLIFSDGFRVSRRTRAIKRLLDLAIAIVGGLIAAPLMLLTAAIVKLDSRGPALYSQERVGENGVIFTLYKFRSMRIDAEGATPVWARDRDDRITRVGRFIRTTRLDELPQLWNVIRGDMSFVGPRPERPYFVEQLAAVIPFYMERHAVKPGLTGWAQVKYRYGSSVEDATEKLRYDLYYLKHMSIVFDLTIAVDTVKVMLFGKGAK